MTNRATQTDILAPGYGTLIAGRRQGSHLYLNGAFGDDKLLKTVAHEVRHVWQKRDLGAAAATHMLHPDF